MEAQACPLCLAGDVVTLLVDNHGKDKNNDGAKNGRTLKRCRRCGVTYLHPLPEPHQLKQLFAGEYITREDDVEVRFGSRPLKCYRAVAAFIQERKDQGRILDVGCAGGHFLERFSGSGWEKWGIDLSHFAAERAARKSIRVHVGDLHSADLPRQSIDVITVLNTFYYFARPQRELAVIRDSLKPDGLLVIALPSAAVHVWRNTGWRRQTFRSRSPWSGGDSLFDSNHLFFYNPKSLQHLLGECGFEALAVRPLPALGQSSGWLEWVAGGYSALSAAAWRSGLSKEMLAAQFLVAAKPAQI